MKGVKQLLTVFFCCFCFWSYSQEFNRQAYKDSVQLAHQLQFVDSLKTHQSKAALRIDTIIYQYHPYYHFTQPLRQIISERHWQGKEAIFYCIAGLLLFFALIRNGFAKYLHDLFQLFFRTTLRQRHIKEQLMQTPLPSLLLNIHFILSAGLFISLVLWHFRFGTRIGFWYLLLYCLAGVTCIYIIKFMALKFSGWLLRISESTDAYIFIVFTSNKIIGIIMLPFLVLLGFTAGPVYETALTLGAIIIGGLFTYRIYLAYLSVHRQIALNLFHFFLYLAAFEIVPLLLINKVLVMFFA